MFDNTKKYGIITKDGYVSVGAPNPDGGIATRYDVKKYVSANAQEKLVSGTNIKTINNQSILGSGNINISGGGTSDDVYTKQEADDRFAVKTEISDMLTKTEASNTYQPKGEYATTEQLNNKSIESTKIETTDIPNLPTDSEIHKLQKKGKVIYPATTTDAVVDAETKKSLYDIILQNNINSINTDKLYIKDIIVENSYFNSSNGIINSSELFKRTKKLYLPAKEKIEFSGELLNVHTWDALGNHINEGKVSALSKDYDCYFGINFNSDTDISKAFISNKNSLYNKINLCNESLSQANENINKISKETPFFLNKKTIDFIDGYFIDVLLSDATLEERLVSNPYYKYSIIEIEEENYLCKYTSEIGGVSSAVVAFFDSEDKLLSYTGQGSSSGSNLYKDKIVSIPQNTKKIAFTSKIGSVDPELYISVLEINSVISPEDILEIKNKNNNLTEIIDNISSIESKNIFPGVTVGGYVNSKGGFNFAATEDLYAATDFIPVKPNTYYYISNRNVNGIGGSTNIRCLDENKENPTKVRIASTGEEFNSWYTPNEDGTSSTDNGQIKTSPTAAYLQMNLKFAYQENPNYAQLMLEEVGENYNPDFVPSPYQPYAEEYKVKKSALPDDIGGGGNIVGTVSLNNTPMFLLVGASHGEGYGSVKDKAFISYLSAMLDWSVENYSRSGSDYAEHFNSLEIGQQISNVYPGDMAGGIALVVLGGNESNYYSNGVDGKYFRANIIRCCSALKALGYRPILSSYYGDMGRPWSLVVREVAREYGYLYLDLNGYGSRFYSPIYRPWWYNAHYATRTNVIQWYSFMKLLADIERPQTALKIFRNRNPYTQIGELLFDNNIEKMRYWRELTLHHIPLKPGFEKYVDRLDLCVYTNTSGETVNINAVEGVQSEYNIARKGGTISMDDTGLLQFTFPAVGKYLTNVKFHIESDDTLEVYIRKYIDPSLQISLSDASAAFGITTATPNIIIGDVYTDSNNPGVNFTVTQYTNGTLIATPNGSFTAPGNTTGTLTRTSGTGTATLEYNTLRTAPGATYFANAFNKLGMWEALNGSGGVYELKGLVNYLDYDRCDMLVKKSGGGAFVLKNVSADYEATQLKDVKRYDTAKMLGYVEGDGTQILTKTTFENPQDDWGLAVGKGVVWDGKVTYTDGNDVQQTGNHIPTYFSSQKGVTQILRLNAGAVLTQALPTMQGASYEVQRYKLKLTARYYPSEALDIDNLPDDVRTSQTFDFARIDVRFVLTGANSYYTKTYYAPLNWVEIEDELVFDAPISVPNQIVITAVDDRIELMLCEIIRI